MAVREAPLRAESGREGNAYRHFGGRARGLYFAHRWKKRHPETHVDLFEQNAANATWGFGVVFSDRAWDFLRSDDPETAEFLSPQMESWQNIRCITLISRWRLMVSASRR